LKKTIFAKIKKENGIINKITTDKQENAVFFTYQWVKEGSFISL